MKLLFLVACIGMAAAASLRSGQLTAKTPRELTYQYDTQVATGIEEVSNQFSTVRMSLRVQMRTDGAVDGETGAEKWTLVFTEASLRQRNNATQKLPKSLLPMEEFRNLDAPELWRQIERTLKKPFAVLLRPKELAVVKVLFSDSDPFWSVNIKKGFLNMLQLNFIPKDASRSDMERGQWTKETDEMTVAALCKTLYSANKIEYHESDSPVFRVVKAIDFNNCLNPVDGTRGLAGKWNGLRHQERLPGQEEPSDLVSINNMAEYLVDMGSDRASPVIRKASARTVHILSPNSDSTHGSEKIFSVQKMELLTGDAVSAPILEATDSLTEQPEGLRLIYPQEAKNVDREALKREVAQLFSTLWKSSNEIDLKAYEQIVRILRFHLNSVEDLETVAQQLVSHSNRQRALRVFIIDICPQVVSHGSIQYLMRIVKALAKTGPTMEVVEQAQLTAYDIPVIFAKLSMTSKIQLKTLQTVLEVVNDEAFRTKMMTAEHMPIYSAAWLSLSAMTNVYYVRQGGVEPHLNPIADAINSPWEVRRSHAAGSEEFRREFIAAVTAGLRRTDAGRNLALKVTKNCGLFELYDHIGPMIRKRDTRAVAERVQAVYATQNMLRRSTLVRVTAEDARSIAQEEKYIRSDSEHSRHFEAISSRIQADLVACFRNVREDPELRIACYRVLMQCPNVKQSVLNMLVQAILSEPTQQVYAYCVSHMSQIASSSLPRYYRVRQTVHSTLSMLQRREPMDQVYSRVFHGQLFDELHKMGLTIETDMIVSDKSFVPRWTHIRFDQQAMGQNVPVLEIALRTQGLQGLLEKLFGPRGLMYKSGNFVQLLKRATRSLDASIDSELLDILPRILAEVPNMDLTVALMGYDVVYVKNIREVARSAERLNAKALGKMLTNFGSILKPFTGLFSISANYELPTPAGTILDLNCFMTADFWPKVTIQNEMTEGKARIHVKASLPIVIKGLKRFGSNMHILNHYHQWFTTVNVNKQSSQEFVIQMDLTNPSHRTLSILLAAPGARSPIVQFKNVAFSTIAESVFQEGRIRTTNKNSIVVHRQIAQQKTADFYPVLGSLLAPFGYKLQVKGKYYSTSNLYQAPCSLLSGPSEYTVFLKPTTEEDTGRTVFISSKLEVIFQEEERSKLPQVKLQVNNVRIQSDGSETVRQKLVSAAFKPRDSTAERTTFQCSLRYHLGLPSSYRVNGYQLTVNGQIEMPQDLKMTPKSLPLQAEEWFVDRQLRMSLRIADEESEVATIEVEMSPNTELKKLLVHSDLSELQMQKTFPRLTDCLNETKKSIQEEPLRANPLFTPSCIRQFKKFNKLSQTKVEISKRANWFMNPKNSPLFDAAVSKVQEFLKPYLVLSEVPRMTEEKIVIVSRPSPVDIRVHHLNITCPTRKNIWRSIQLPSVPFFWAGVDPIVTAASDYAKGGSSKCSLLHSHVRTFDNVVYSIPKSVFSKIADNQCPMLLAKDCSDSKEFQVLAHIKDGKKYITLHLNTEGSRPFVIEVSKPINADQKKSTVKVNGAELEHSEGPEEETEILRRSVNTEKGPVTVVISKYQYADTIMYKIRSVQHQIQVLVGGSKLRSVEVRVSPFYRNRVCGLCGDYNAEKFREFKGPNYHRVVMSAKKMVQQYILPVSDSCRMDLSDYSKTESSELYRPNYYSYKSHDMPRRRPSCQIVSDRKVKSFKHAEFELMSPALKQIIRDTDCAVKLAVAKIGDNRVRVYLRPSRSEVLIKVGDRFQQRLSIASPASTERSANPLPSDLTVNLEAKESRVVFELVKDDNRVTVIVTSDRRVIIKASQVDESEDAVCELSHPSQMAPADGDRLYQTLKKFTNSEESSVCRDQLKKRINQCHVSPNRVQPFHRAGESSWWQPRYLNSELQSRLAETKAPLILSVDQISEEATASAFAYSVQLVHERRSERLTRHIVLKKNRQSLVKISVTEAPVDVSVTYLKDGSERTVKPASGPVTLDMDANFRLIVSSERVRVSHKSSLYEIEVQPLSGLPEVTIVRPYAHPSYPRVGLCQVNKLSQVREHHTNPRAVLEGALRASLASLAESAEAPIVSEEEVGRINRLLSQIVEASPVRDFEY